MTKGLQVLLVLWLVAVGLCGAATAQVGPLELEGHPRLFLPEGELEDIRVGLQADPYRLVVHREILEECDRLLSSRPVEHVKVGIRLLSQCREAMLRIFYLSYGWRMTAEPKYLERAKAELRAIANFKDWNPSHFLDVAEMTIAASIGYDWLYGELSAQERAAVRTAILEKGLRPSLDEQYNWWLTADHNWNQVCNAGMLIGALAIYEDNRSLADDITGRSTASIARPMKDYGPDGAYPEGYMYWGYGTTFNVLFIDCLERALGRPYDFAATPGFMQTGGFMQNMTGPTGDSFNFSDSDLGSVLQPAMFWFAQRTGQASLLWSEREHMLKLRANVREDNRLLPLTLIWGAKIDLRSISPPQNKIWAGHGKTPVALMRTSWTDSLATYVGFKGGSPSTNHGHMDVGSFVLESGGVRWAMDYGKEDYQLLEAKKLQIWKFDQNSERWQVFKYTNYAHNTLSVDRALQHVKGYAPLMAFAETANGATAKMDLSSVYPGLTSLQREISVDSKSGVTVTDFYIGTEQEKDLCWAMLTDAEVRLTETNTVELRKAGKRLRMECLGDKRANWVIKPAEGGYVILGLQHSIAKQEKSSLSIHFSLVE